MSHTPYNNIKLTLYLDIEDQNIKQDIETKFRSKIERRLLSELLEKGVTFSFHVDLCPQVKKAFCDAAAKIQYRRQMKMNVLITDTPNDFDFITYHHIINKTKIETRATGNYYIEPIIFTTNNSEENIQSIITDVFSLILNEYFTTGM